MPIHCMWSGGWSKTSQELKINTNHCVISLQGLLALESLAQSRLSAYAGIDRVSCLNLCRYGRGMGLLPTDNPLNLPNGVYGLCGYIILIVLGKTSTVHDLTGTQPNINQNLHCVL